MCCTVPAAASAGGEAAERGKPGPSPSSPDPARPCSEQRWDEDLESSQDREGQESSSGSAPARVPRRVRCHRAHPAAAGLLLPEGSGLGSVAHPRGGAALPGLWFPRPRAAGRPGPVSRARCLPRRRSPPRCRARPGRSDRTPRGRLGGPARGAGLSLAALSDGSPSQSAARSAPPPPVAMAPAVPAGRGPRRMEAAAAAPAEAPVPAEFVRRWLRAEGADPAAPAEEQLGLAWRLLRRAEARLGDLERRRAEELREVESYVGHVRNLTEERDNVITEYEKENEHLRDELMQLQLQQGGTT